MHPKRSLAAVVLAATLIVPAGAQALELGVQDDWQMRNDPATLLQAGHEARATWIRMIVSVGDAATAEKIRAAHASGFKVLLTIGGVGTATRAPSAAALLAYLRTLPLAERYTVINEPDLAGINACMYRRTWMAVRRVLGSSLLFGDFSPHAPFTMTAAMSRCGSLPNHLEFALHPYQFSDPLARGHWQGGIGNLSRARRELHQLGITVDWWLTEFGYLMGPGGWTDQQAATMWTRAISQAKRQHARMLGIYMAQGPTWDSKPRAATWSVLTGA